MLTIFYSTGTLKKKRFATYLVGFGMHKIEHKMWFGDFEPEPARVKSRRGKIWIDEAPSQKKKNLPKEFLPKPAYRGAK